MKALILAAGYAMRLYPLTQDKPKALLPIGGKLMLDYLMDEIQTVPEIDGCVLVTNHRFADQFRIWADSRSDRVPCEILDDGTDSNETRLGAIGDIAYTLDKTGLDDDLLIVASDNLFTFPLSDFVNDWKRHGCDCIAVQEMESIEERRRFAIAELDEDMRVLSIVEKPQDPQGDVAVYALYLYRRDTLPLFRDYLAEGNPADSPGNFPVWLCKRREMRAYRFEGECVDIGTLESYRAVCEQYEKEARNV